VRAPDAQAAAAKSVAQAFQLSALPDGFYDDPYPYFAALTEHDPVHVLADGSLILAGYADVVAMYRNPVASSDKKVEFLPKFGDTPLIVACAKGHAATASLLLERGADPTLRDQEGRTASERSAPGTAPCRTLPR